MKFKLPRLTTLVLLSALVVGCIEQAHIQIKPEREKKYQIKVQKCLLCNKFKYPRKREYTNSREELGIEDKSVVESIIDTIKLLEDENKQNKKEKIKSSHKFHEEIEKQIYKSHKRHQEKLHELYKQNQKYKSQQEDKVPKFYRQRFHRKN